MECITAAEVFVNPHFQSVAFEIFPAAIEIYKLT